MASISLVHRPGKPLPFQVHGHTLVDGKRVSLPGKSFATRKAAEIYKAELLLQVDRDGGLADPSHLSFGGFLDYWLKNHPKPLSATTRGGYAEHIRRIKPSLGKIPLTKLRAGDLDRAYAKLLQEGGKPRSLEDIKAKNTKVLSTTTVNGTHRCVKTALRQGFKWGFVPANCADRATPPPIRRASQVRAYDKNERAKVLVASEMSSYPYLSALLKLLGMTGARRSEAIGIAVPDVDFDARTITICRTIVQVGKEVLVREGVGKSASMIGAGVDVATVAAQLGHSSPAITLRTYLHPDEERSRAGANTLGGVFDLEKK